MAVTWDGLTDEQRRHRADLLEAIRADTAARRKPTEPHPPRDPQPPAWNEPPPPRDTIDGVIDDLPPRAGGTTLQELFHPWP